MPEDYLKTELALNHELTARLNGFDVFVAVVVGVTVMSIAALAVAQAVAPSAPVPVDVGIAGFSPSVTLAIVTGAFAFLALFPPILMVVVQAWIAGRTKAQEWKRLDEVAAAARAAAAAAQQAQADAAIDRKETASTLADGQTQTAEHLDRQDKAIAIVHALVNSNLTAAMQSDLDSTRRELAAQNLIAILLEAAVIPGQTSAGREAAHAAALEAITIAQAKIETLTTALAERKRQQAAVDGRAEMRTRATDGSPGDEPIPVKIVADDPVPVNIKESKR